MFEKVIEEFKKNGFALIPDFLTDDEVKQLKKSVDQMVDRIDVNTEKLKTDQTVNPNTDISYLDAAGGIHFFFEEEAFDEKGNLRIDKHRALFRIGMALHCLDSTFKKITFSEKVKALVNELSYAEPCVAQSMYIFKNPEIGCKVIPHQDATYLHTIGDEIREIGLWFPMEDADEENGCLSFIPGSHKTGLHRQMVPNEAGKTPNFVFTNDSPDYPEKDFVSLPAKKGSCVLIDGLVVHRSAQNRSKRGRPIYTFHIYDRKACEWDPKNWIQPTVTNPFPALYVK